MGNKASRQAWTAFLGGKQTDIVKSRPKYGNEQAEADNINFQSKKERDRYIQLRTMQRGGVIRDLELQKRFKIIIGEVPIVYASGRILTYVADFTYFDIERNRHVIEDAKGVRTQVFKIKKALMAAMGYHIEEV